MLLHMGKRCGRGACGCATAESQRRRKRCEFSWELEHLWNTWNSKIRLDNLLWVQVLLCPIQEGCPLKSRDFLLKIPKRNIFQGPNMLNHLLREPISVFKAIDPQKTGAWHSLVFVVSYPQPTIVFAAICMFLPSCRPPYRVRGGRIQDENGWFNQFNPHSICISTAYLCISPWTLLVIPYHYTPLIILSYIHIHGSYSLSQLHNFSQFLKIIP